MTDFKPRNIPQIDRIPSGKGSKAQYDKQRWVSTHIDYHRWKKTPDFDKWKHKQFLSQGGLCYYCDEPLWSTRNNVDHLIAKIHGGSNDKNNLVLACWTCNKNKGYTKLSHNEIVKLKKKNAKRSGTYLQNRELYRSEEEIALELRNKFM